MKDFLTDKRSYVRRPLSVSRDGGEGMVESEGQFPILSGVDPIGDLVRPTAFLHLVQPTDLLHLVRPNAPLHLLRTIFTWNDQTWINFKKEITLRSTEKSCAH